MTLTLAPAAGIGHNQPPAASVPSAGLTRLSDDMLDTIRSYFESQQLQSRLQSEADAAKKVADAAKAVIVKAMGDATAAVCGEAVVTRADVKPVEATITLASGEKITLAKVVMLILAGDKPGSHRTVDGNEIAQTYGGRTGFTKLSVGGKLS